MHLQTEHLAPSGPDPGAAGEFDVSGKSRSQGTRRSIVRHARPRR